MRIKIAFIVMISISLTFPVNATLVDANDYIAAGNKLARQNDYPGAITQFEKALEKKSTNVRVLLILGLLHAKTGNLDGALRYTSIAASNVPSYPAFFNLGLIHSARTEHNDAIKAFDEALRINPKSFKAHYQKGLAQSNAGSPEKAVDSFQNTLEINPRLHEARIALVGALLKSGDKSSAKYEIEKFREMGQSIVADALTERMNR